MNGYLKLALLAPALAFPHKVLAQECAKEPVTVGFLPKLDTDPYFQVAKQGAEEAQKEIGGKLIQVAPSQGTAEAQIEFINSLVSQQVGVIAISGNDANAVAPALKRAAKQGVRVISYDFRCCCQCPLHLRQSGEGRQPGRDDAPKCLRPHGGRG